MIDAVSGQCLCGAVTVNLTGASSTLEICQCNMCRRWGGAFYAALTAEKAAVTGEDSVTVYKSSAWAERASCGTCGSSLWFRFLPTGNRSFSAGLFEDAAQLPVEKEIFVDERADWCRIEGEHRRMTGDEIIAEAKAAGFTFD